MSRPENMLGTEISTSVLVNSPIYTDVFREGQLLYSCFHNHKTYRFVKSKFIMDPMNNNIDNLVRFLTQFYSVYDALLVDFRLHKVIEYYVKLTR